LELLPENVPHSVAKRDHNHINFLAGGAEIEKKEKTEVNKKLHWIPYIYMKETTSSEMNLRCKNLEETSSTTLLCLSFHSSHR